VATNRGGRHDGEKQRTWHSGPLLSAALLRDEVPLGGSTVLVSGV
jgi:hypothetical protein